MRSVAQFTEGRLLCYKMDWCVNTYCNMAEPSKIHVLYGSNI